MKKVEKKVRATAKCASFDIELHATIVPNGSLAASEVADIQRKLRQKLAETVSGLPFAHIYSHEVRVR